ncbi:MAG TPA: hypothetical protein VHH35_02005 [Pyrinomonadaceae bacterium]|nr:hypothetical protein [Pyrinomonadaceae bacterium]
MNDSIRLLYEVFADIRKPKDFPACECCLSDHQKRVLLNGELSKLSAEELDPYVIAVFLTTGSVADFKYFLPRILELAIADQFLWSAESVLGKLPMAGWNEWPERERVAVLRVLQEELTRLLKDEDSCPSSIDGWICALGCCVSDITPYLDQLLAVKHHLLSFVESNFAELQDGELANTFWSHAPENKARVLAWLNSAEVRRVLSEEYGMVFPCEPD